MNDAMCSMIQHGICYYGAGLAEQLTPPMECQPVVERDVRYVRVDQAMNFADAQAYCRANYHDLASIHNAQENAAALLACQGGGTSAIIGDWHDLGTTSPFYGGSVVHITETGGLSWSVEGNTYVDGDVLTILRIGNGFLLNEHDTASNHDFGHMVTMDPAGTLKVFTRPGGNAADDRIWHLTRVSAPLHNTGICIIGFHNSAPGNQWEWSDGSPTAFQNWLGGEGAVSANNNRDAMAALGLCDTGDATAACADGSAAHWNDRNAGHTALSG